MFVELFLLLVGFPVNEVKKLRLLSVNNAAWFLGIACQLKIYLDVVVSRREKHFSRLQLPATELTQIR